VNRFMSLPIQINTALESTKAPRIQVHLLMPSRSGGYARPTVQVNTIATTIGAARTSTRKNRAR
jgi:hypothetical protein